MKILVNQSLRFARASEMNDPFDLLIDDWVGVEANQFFQESNALLFEIFLARPELLAAKFQMDSATTKGFAEAIQDLTDDQKAALRNEANTTMRNSLNSLTTRFLVASWLNGTNPGLRLGDG